MGAQDAFYKKDGAFTGEISPAMLKKEGVEYLILGHSEKRALGDTNEIINKKLKLAIDYRLRVILCVGERERDDHGEYLNFIRSELEEGLKGLNKNYFKYLIVAYEPIWAIGKNAKSSSTPEDFLEKSIFIKKVLHKLTDRSTLEKIPILYGGSVDESNALSFLQAGEADGLLVGRASLDPARFNSILDIANSL